MPKRKPTHTQHSSTQMIHARTRSAHSADETNHFSYKKMFIFLMSITAVLLAAGSWVYSRRESDEVTLGLDTDNFDYATGPHDYSVGFHISASHPDLVALQEMAGIAARKLFEDSLFQIQSVIRNELPCLFSFKLLDWLLSRPQVVRIVPVPWQVFQRDYPNTEAVYMTGELSKYGNNEPQIYLKIAPNLLNVNWTLRNEFFHGICDQVNRKKTEDIAKRALPFLNEKGEIDSLLQQEFFHAMEMAGERILRLTQLLKLSEEDLKSNPAKQIELSSAETVLSTYKPYEFELRLPKNIFKSISKKSSGSNMVIPKDTIVNGKPLKQDFEIMVTKHAREGDQVAVTYTHTASSKAKLFDMDHRVLTNLLHTRYSKEDENMWYVEAASLLEMLPAKVKQYFAPEFCSFMGGATKLGKEYCAIPMHRQCLGVRLS